MKRILGWLGITLWTQARCYGNELPGEGVELILSYSLSSSSTPRSVCPIARWAWHKGLLQTLPGKGFETEIRDPGMTLDPGGKQRGHGELRQALPPRMGSETIQLSYPQYQSRAGRQ